MCLPMANCVFCHTLCTEQRETALRVQNNGLTVPGSYPPCRPNLSIPGTGRGTRVTAMPRVPGLQRSFPPGQEHHKRPQKVQSEPYLEGSQSAKLEKCLNSPPCVAALIGSWAPGLNWQLRYQLELVTSPSPDKDRSGRGAKARQMQDIWKAALGPGLSSSLPPTRGLHLHTKCALP